MRKLIVCLCAYLIVASSFSPVTADEANSASYEARVTSCVTHAYEQIDFGKNAKVSREVFANAYKGYLNLLNAGLLNADKHILTICDFSKPSTEKRLWVIDLATRKTIFNTYVAHGQGSGDNFAVSFSNTFDSHQSSLGFYVTGETYLGDHGISLKLKGMDNGFNDRALDRGIVVHGADYVSEKYIACNERLGRSWGCPAVPNDLKEPIINTIKDGTCLFIYYPDNKYMASSYWLTKKIFPLPENSKYEEIPLPAVNAPRMQIIQYINNGKIDSVRSVPICK